MLYTVHFRSTAQPDAVARILRDLGWELQAVGSDMEPRELANGDATIDPEQVSEYAGEAKPEDLQAFRDAQGSGPKQELKENFGARVPETGKAGLGDLDNSGMPWDERIHSPNKTKTGAGLWRKKKGVHADVVKKVEAERRVEGTVNGAEAVGDEDDDGQQEPQDSAADDFGINAGQHEAPEPENNGEWESGITKDHVRDKLKEVSKVKGLEACLSVLQQYDAQNVSGLNPDDYHAVYLKLEEVGAQ